MREPTRDLLDSLLDRQGREWLAGRRLSVEALLDGSEFRDDPDAQLDLIYNEILLRERLGEETAAEEYVRRYPHLQDALALHFEVHGALDDPLLEQTARLAGADTVPIERPGLRRPDPAGYEPVDVLGRGGMAVVYKARHGVLRRTVALKTFEPGRRPSPREVLRFRSEAEAIARLRHPNIVQIYEIGECDGLPFLALELAEEGTLADRLRNFAYAPRPAAELIETLARAVHHAHENGVVHRDLKPANVLFAAGAVPKLTDFGLAKVFRDDPGENHDATRTGDPLGTPRYMAPEQAGARHALVGPATDVYALGTLLYECLTGRVPFLAAGVVDTLDQIRTAEPPPPRRFRPAVPRDLETICLHCLHKEPGRRYPTAAALAADLRRFLDREPIMARPTPPWERAWKWCRRRPAHAALLAVAAVLLAGGVTAAGVRHRVERARIEYTRIEVEELAREGQEALDRNDEDTAEARFRQAWVKVKGEPALRDFETGIAGWLDHSRRAADRRRWKQRVPPREFDEKRDEAMLLSLLLDPLGRPAVSGAREAVAAALDLTLPDDPAWRREREQLVLLDAALIHADAGAGPALARLGATGEFSSRPFFAQQASYLDGLGRPDEATAVRRRAAALPPTGPSGRLHDGMTRARGRDFAGAAREFEAVLDAEPEHFTARLFLAVCAVQLDRPGEAKVGLTACIAQRPRFAWNYLYRGRCAEKLGDPVAARRDFARAAELQPGIPNR